MGPQELYLKRIAKDPFLKYFRPVQGPSGAVGYERRINTIPGATPRDPGVTRQAADIYREKTGKTYGGTLLPIKQDPTYKSSSFGKADVVKSQAEAKNFRRTASQKTLFGGNIRDLFPSLKRSLTKRRMAKKQLEKQGQTLGA